jgi:Activator of Hsp90 ATPase homolog 1-like protein
MRRRRSERRSHAARKEIADDEPGNIPPERLVHTESFDDFPGESQIITEFAEQNGRTTLTITSLSPSREVRDAILKGGTDGMAECYDKLAEILAASAGAPSITGVKPFPPSPV